MHSTGVRLGTSFALLFVTTAAAPAQSPEAERAASLLSFGDFDNDGLLDAYVVRPQASDGLYRNLGDGTFAEVGQSLGLGSLTGSRLAHWLDYDGDGWVDLYVGGAGGGGRLARNDRGLAFVDVTLEAGLAHEEGAELLAESFDYDLDGWVDLRIVTARTDLLFRNLGGTRFELVELGSPGARPFEAVIALSPPRGETSSGGSEPAGGMPDGATGVRTSKNRVGHASAARVAGAPGSVGLTVTTGCAGSVRDQAGGACIQASTTPTLGDLYPLSTNLNVSATGKVGIGTTAPSAGLHVNSDDGVLATGTYGSGAIPAQGAGTRLMWYSGKAAFRAGSVSGAQWDATSVGSDSAAVGYDTTASGNYSTATGYKTTASGAYSTATGFLTTASGSSTTALGNQTTASGSSSTALGSNTTASGALSTAMGSSTDAEAWGSVAMGKYNVGGGDPLYWVASDPLFEVGNGASSVARSNALTVLKDGRVGLGTASPEAPLHVSEGSAGTVTADSNASAVFERNSANYVQLLAPSASQTGIIFGNPTSAASGGIYYNSTVANGLNFNANGNSTKMVIDSSGRVGMGTPAPGNRLDLVGAGTAAGGVAGDSEVTARFLQSTASTHSAVSVDAGTGLDSILYLAESGSAVWGLRNDASAGDNFDLRYHGGGANTRVLTVEPTGDVGIGRTPTANALELEGNASKTTAGSWLANSDRRIKTEVREIEGALAVLDRIRPVAFHYTEEYRAEHPSIEDTDYYNVIAQEFAEVFPDSVKPSGEGDLLQVDTYPALIHALAAIQELHELSRTQAAELAALRAELAELRASPAASTASSSSLPRR